MRFQPAGKNPYSVPHTQDPGYQSPGYDGSETGATENTIDGEKHRSIRIISRDSISQFCKRSFEFVEADGLKRRDRMNRDFVPELFRKPFSKGVEDLRQIRFRNLVTLCGGADDVPDPEQVKNFQVLEGLSSEAFVGRDDEKRAVRSRRSLNHDAHESLMSWNIHDAGLQIGSQEERRKSELDGNAPGFFFGKAVRVEARQSADQRRLSVVHVAGCGDHKAFHANFMLENGSLVKLW